jgi:hypothetical protein
MSSKTLVITSLLNNYNKIGDLKSIHHLLCLYKDKINECNKIDNFEFIMNEILGKFNKDALILLIKNIEKCFDLYKDMYNEKLIEIQTRYNDEVIKFIQSNNNLSSNEALFIKHEIDDVIENYSLSHNTYSSFNNYMIKKYNDQVFQRIIKVLFVN